MDKIETREKARLAYSKDSEGYDAHRLKDARGRLLSEHDLKLFETMLPSIPADATVLEIGAGTGRFTIPLLEKGKTVIATDINEEMLRLLREKIKEKGHEGHCEVKVEDAFALSFEDGKFDLAMSFHVIPRLLSEEDQEAALTEISRVIAPKGILFFNFRNSFSPYRLLYKGHAISTTRIREILAKNGFSITKMRGKHFITRKLIDALPNCARKPLAKLDSLFWSVFPSLAWDVFVLAKKD